MKKITLIMGSALLLVLAGCQANEGARTMSEETEATETATDTDELPIEATEYGRGARSDGADTNNQEAATRILTDVDSIIIYFSRSGNTQNLARLIHNETGADMLELTVTEPYPADYEETVDRANEERANQNYPEINTDIPDLTQYDRVYLGYQTWAMTLSNPMIAFLEDNGSALADKTIYPFSTNAGYGEGDTLERIAELAPDATLADSFSIQDEDLLQNQEQITEWLNQNDN